MVRNGPSSWRHGPRLSACADEPASKGHGWISKAPGAGPAPARAARLRNGDAAVVESVKAASDVYAPVSGTVTEGNGALEGDPALINSDPEGEGWFFKLTLADPAELDGLMDEAAYKAYVNGL